MRLWIVGGLAVAASVAAAAWRVVEDRPHPPDFSEAFAPGKPSTAPRHWMGQVESRCPLSGPVAAPSICVAAPAKASYARGEAIGARISWRGVPANSSIVVYLTFDQPDETGRLDHYLGMTGALTPEAIPISGDGALDFAWNGHDFPCAPADLPMLCKGSANIGRYGIAVALYARDRVAIVGWPDPNPPAVLAVATSAPFVVTGTPDLAETARELWWAATDQAMAQRDIQTSSILGDMSGTMAKPYQRGDRICAAIPATPPYRSTLEACAPMAKLIGDAGLLPVQKADITVTGHVTVIPGTLSRERAVALAQDVADKPYIGRVAFRRQPTMEEAGYRRSAGGVPGNGLDDERAWDLAHPRATTYLNDGPGETVYRPDLGGGWAIVVNEIMAGGTLPQPQRFADKVLVFVTAGGKACVIETRRYRADDFSRDPKTAKFACP